MSHYRSLLTFALSTTMLLAQQAEPPLDQQRFDELWQQLSPDPAAPWRTIPWRIDLLAAQREAAAGHKPLFIWAMDGHPLGCT